MAFQRNDARKFEPFPPAAISTASKPVALHLDVSIEVVGVETSERTRRRLAIRVKNQASGLLEQTGFFRLRPDDQAADYRLELHVRKECDPDQSVGRFAVSLFTLFLIPSIEGARYTTDVRLTDARGDALASKQYRHKFQEAIQLFLLLGLPLRQWPDRVTDEMWQAVLRDVAVWAADETGKAAASQP
jgi:hypothetical protein